MKKGWVYAFVFAIIIVASIILVSSVNLDLNHDGVINITDLQILAAHFEGKATYNSSYDLNNNGKVDLFDIVSVARKVKTTPVCEASAGGTCYYINPVNGSDSNNGSFYSPWKSFREVAYYYSSAYKPVGWVQLNPGDTIYLMSGIYNDSFCPDNCSGLESNPPSRNIVKFRNYNGDPTDPFTIKAYPGEHPILDPSYTGMGIYLILSSYWNISGITIKNANQTGLKLKETNQVKISNITIYDTDGVDNNNMAGMYITSVNNLEINSSVFHDNYDRTAADTGGNGTHNSADVVLFDSNNISVHDSYFYQTPTPSSQKSGDCLKVKFANTEPSSYFLVYRNNFTNCKFYALKDISSNTLVEYNLFNSSDMGIQDAREGPAHQDNQTFEYNTFYLTGAFHFDPTIADRSSLFPNDPSDITFKNNIIYDNASSYPQDNTMIEIDPYMNDTLYNIIVPQLHFSTNCYYNPITEIKFGIGAQNGGSYGVEGGIYNLAQWQADLGYDSGSIIANPMFVNPSKGDFRIQAGSPCAGLGAFPSL